MTSWLRPVGLALGAVGAVSGCLLGGSSGLATGTGGFGLRMGGTQLGEPRVLGLLSLCVAGGPVAIASVEWLHSDGQIAITGFGTQDPDADESIGAMTGPIREHEVDVDDPRVVARCADGDWSWLVLEVTRTGGDVARASGVVVTAEDGAQVDVHFDLEMCSPAVGQHCPDDDEA